MSFRDSLLFCLVFPISFSAANDRGFDKLTLTEEFHSEGIAVADIDRDGENDIVSGPYWYAGPEFRQRHRYSAGDPLSIKGYSRHFFTWAHDFNADGAVDILTVGMPGNAAFWFENPGTTAMGSRHWIRRKVFDGIGNESPAFVNLLGDARPELVCIHKGAFCCIEYRMAKGEVLFSRRFLTDNLGLDRFTHGLGVADIDGDGKADLLETRGWWQQQPDQGFVFHPIRFAEGGGAQMHAYDIDGDGDNDVICSQNAHGYGLKWFEQRREGTRIDFVPHTILSDKPSGHPLGLAVSQLHAAALADIDGDGIQDLVTGKRFWAHGGGDPGARQLPVLFWLKTIRRRGRVHFAPRLIDGRSGVGTQVTVADINRDGKPDIAVGNKLGTRLFLQNPKAPAQAWEDLPLAAGSGLFEENIRSTEPLEANQQQKTFLLPQGFEIQLVAAEPEIAKPMNMAFDDQGRLWVSSSREYPHPAGPGKKPRDTIRILEDDDGDGRADNIKTFADGLNIPMGLLHYREGVICFSIPNIWYLRDTDGDDRVDRREILFGPFDTSRDTHGMCNSFTLGNDGWIYACHGFNNQSRVAGKDGHEVILNSGNVFRFKPDGSRIELVTQGQVNPFGMTLDARGDFLTADCHTRPINLILPGGHHDSFGKPHDGLGYIPNVMEHLHGSTGIAGVALGAETHFPAVYQQSTFGGNVVTGRINRNHLVYSGSSMSAREEPDFLVPGDPWFRPVDLKVGPGGALYIADFYNRIIGHYEVDLDHPGRDRTRGRIWKVVYRGDPGRRDAPGPVRQSGNIEDRGIDLLQQIRSANRARQRMIRRAVLEEVTLGRKEATNPGEGKHEAAILHALRALAQPAPNRTVIPVGLARILRELDADAYTRLLNSGLRGSESFDCFVLQSLANQATGAFETEVLRRTLREGLVANSPFVKRAAALAVSKHPSLDLTKELVQQIGPALQTGDRFLLHSLKIALREQFRMEAARLPPAVSSLEPDGYPVFADVCMAVRSPLAAAFIVNHLQSLSLGNPQKLTAYLEFAARHADQKSIDRIVAVAEEKFAGNVQFQLKILDSLRTGIAQNNRDLPGSIQQLAGQIAKRLLRLRSDRWQVVSSARSIPFGTRRVELAHGGQGLLIDTLARGESGTGTLRSRPFVLGDEFVFSLAGHDSGGEEKSGENFVRLVLVEENLTIGKIRVPGSDVAEKKTIATPNHRGEKAVLEIVDGCAANAFAWIAAGEFSSNPEMNPSPGWHVDPEVAVLDWSCHVNEASADPAEENIFVLSTRRKSIDGQQETPLWSSIVKGEQKTGVYRSEPFEMDDFFRFYLAGHDGFPDKPLSGLNYVQLRLADSGQVVHKTPPPRHDTAHLIEWDTASWRGERAYLEIVDQDSANAYAWLAAGRFSVAGLNPAERNGDRLQAARVIADFQLENLREPILGLIATSGSRSLQAALCRSLASFYSDHESRHLFGVTADLVSLGNTDPVQANRAVESIVAGDSELAKSVIRSRARTFSAAQQRRFADSLSVERSTAGLLVELLERGSIGIDVLSQPALVAKIRGHGQSSLTEKVDAMTGRLPKIDAQLEQTIRQRKRFQRNAVVDLMAGKKLYEKNCASCHQIGGVGQSVGPNLDGIGNRGIDRLVDDILMPNRNVDIAFRASLVETADGRLLSGFLKPGQGPGSKNLTLVDREGKRWLIAEADVVDKKRLDSSPMPANFSETLNEQQFANLLAYLLSR
ncbi:MAG: PVC-type heme-binding CxxCH protein [Planctomycetota bacterium]|nr:PVC-type heme-binding CxxCH protein [Planctomycetota bacterium]